MLTEKQIKMIELLVEGEMTVTAILKEVGVPKSTYYQWRRNNVNGFQTAYDEAVEERVKEAKKNIRADINKYIKRLDELSANGANENARVNAISKLLTLAELDPQFKQEILLKTDDSEQKNIMLEMLEKKKEETKEE